VKLVALVEPTLPPFRNRLYPLTPTLVLEAVQESASELALSAEIARPVGAEGQRVGAGGRPRGQ